MKPISVLFLIERPEGWLNVDGLFRFMRRDARFAPEVCVVPAADQPAEARDRQRDRLLEVCRSRDIEPIVWIAGRELTAGRYDVAVFNTPYDRNRPPELYFDVVAQKVRRTVYVPYGLVTGGGHKNQRLQYAQPAQRRADLVIARSEAERAAYRAHCPTGASHVFVSGLPRLDELFDIEHHVVDPALIEQIRGRKALLWSSHFSFLPRFAAAENYSTFDRMAESLFGFAARRPDVALIWRPHPQLFDRLQESGLLTLAEIRTLKREVGALGVLLDERPDHRHAFAASDALLSDAGSFLFEYLATAKPVLYLRNPDGEPLNEEASALVRAYEIAETERDAVDFMDRVARGEDGRRPARLEARARFLPHWDGRASARVAERIVELCDGPPRPGELIDGEQFPQLRRLLSQLATLRDEKARARGGAWVRGRSAAKERVMPYLTEHPALLGAVSRLAAKLRASKVRGR